MWKNKSFWTLIGFFLAGSGFLALMLSLVGVQLAWLSWLRAFGGSAAFLVQLLLIIGGIVLIYLMQTDFKGEDS